MFRGFIPCTMGCMTVVVEPIIGSHVAQEPATPPQHEAGLGERMNRLRAGVLGANDGIVSTAAVVVGVAGATDSTSAIATAGLAAVVGGAISMALGEYSPCPPNATRSESKA